MKKLLFPLFTFLFSIVLICLSYFKVFEPLELYTYDIRLKCKPKAIAKNQLTIVEIAEDTLDKIGRWPFERTWHASLIKVLASNQIKQIFYDIVFSESSNFDDELKNASQNTSVYYPIVFDLKYRKNNFPLAKKIEADLIEPLKSVTAKNRFANSITDIDGKTRRIPLFVEYQNKLYPHLLLQFFCDYLKIDIDKIKKITPREIIFENNFTIPLDGSGNLIINYAGKWADTFKHVSFIDVLQSYYQTVVDSKNSSSEIDLKSFQDSIFFVGATAVGTFDMKITPLDVSAPGIGVLANAFNTINTSNFIVRLSGTGNLIILFFLVLLVVFINLKTKPKVSLILTLIICLSFVIAVFLIFFIFRIWVDLVCPFIISITCYLAVTFLKYLQEQKKRMLVEKELSIARNIQQSFLPEFVPKSEFLDIAAEMITAKQVGGDLYAFRKNENNIGIMIGDVSGKGIPASLYMARTISLFELFIKQNSEAKDVVANLNGELCESSRSNLFVTLIYSIFVQNRKMYFVNAGHMPIILIRKNGSVEKLASNSIPIGLMKSEFEENEIDLFTDDVVVFYTDGVSEARNLENQEFSEERLIKVILQYKMLSAERISANIKKEIISFIGKAPQHDDITLVVIKIK